MKKRSIEDLMAIVESLPSDSSTVRKKMPAGLSYTDYLLILLIDSVRILTVKGTKKKWSKTMSMLEALKKEEKKKNIDQMSIEELEAIYDEDNSFASQVEKLKQSRTNEDPTQIFLNTITEGEDEENE